MRVGGNTAVGFKGRVKVDHLERAMEGRVSDHLQGAWGFSVVRSLGESDPK